MANRTASIVLIVFLSVSIVVCGTLSYLMYQTYTSILATSQQLSAALQDFKQATERAQDKISQQVALVTQVTEDLKRQMQELPEQLQIKMDAVTGKVTAARDRVTELAGNMSGKDTDVQRYALEVLELIGQSAPGEHIFAEAQSGSGVRETARRWATRAGNTPVAEWVAAQKKWASTLSHMTGERHAALKQLTSTLAGARLFISQASDGEPVPLVDWICARHEESKQLVATAK